MDWPEFNPEYVMNNSLPMSCRCRNVGTNNCANLTISIDGMNSTVTAYNEVRGCFVLSLLPCLLALLELLSLLLFNLFLLFSLPPTFRAAMKPQLPSFNAFNWHWALWASFLL